MNRSLLPIGATFQDKHLGWFKVVGHIPNGYGQLVEDVEPCETPIKLQEPKEMKPTPTAAPVRFKWPKIKKEPTAKKPTPKRSAKKAKPVPSLDGALALGSTALAIGTGIALGPLAGVAAFIGAAYCTGAATDRRKRTKRKKK